MCIRSKTSPNGCYLMRISLDNSLYILEDIQAPGVLHPKVLKAMLLRCCSNDAQKCLTVKHCQIHYDCLFSIFAVSLTRRKCKDLKGVKCSIPLQFTYQQNIIIDLRYDEKKVFNPF